MTRSGYLFGRREKISVLTALKAMTIWPEFQYSEESDKGSIEKGKLADFAVLSKNPLTIPKRDLITFKLIQTIKEGRSLYKEK